jgi:hypothetical protein
MLQNLIYHKVKELISKAMKLRVLEILRNLEDRLSWIAQSCSRAKDGPKNLQDTGKRPLN